MWGNLADRLGATDINSTLQKIGNAVAPPPGDYDYDDDEYDDEYDDEEEYDDEASYEEEEENNGGGFGLVGMLTRALDQPGDDDEEEEEAEEEEYDFTPQPAKASTKSVQGNNEFTVQPVSTAVSTNGTSKSIAKHPLNKKEPSPAQTNATTTTNVAVLDMKKKLQQSNDYRREQQKQQQLQEQSRKERDKVMIPATTTTTTRQQNIATGADPRNETKATQPKKEIVKPEQENRRDRIRAIEPHQNISHSTQKRQQVPKPVERPTKVEPANEASLMTYSEPSIKKQQKTIVSTNQSQQGSGGTTKQANEKTVPQDYNYNNTNKTMNNYYSSRQEDGQKLQEKQRPVMKPEEHPQRTVLPQQQQQQQLQRTTMQNTNSTKKNIVTNDPKKQQPVPGYKASTTMTTTTSSGGGDDGKEVLALQRELARAKEEIMQLQRQQGTKDQQSQLDAMRERLLVEFQEKEVRVLQATSEEHQQEMIRLEQSLQSEIHSLTERMANERSEFVQQQEKYRALIDQSQSRAEQAEADLKKFTKRQESQLAQSQQLQERTVLMAEDKVAQTMARLDERNQEVSNLKKLIRTLESKMNEHQEGAEEAEEEVEELQTENETLQEHIDSLEGECADLKSHIADLEADAQKFGGMQMELTMMREELGRERTKNQSVVQSAMTSNNQIELERDEARSEVHDVKQQLTAALADLEIAKADVSRITIANSNLQAALEAFQDERQAEMDLLDEQRKESEEALSCANDAKMDALRQTHIAEMKQVQNAADMAVKNSMDEVKLLEGRIEKFKSENNQMRRSLDEAIHRLQTTQEDVIDRTLMKNILLDWCTMKDKQKRHQVLELMASVLHFTDDEREKVHLTHMDIESVRSKVVGALAAPLPPSKADVEQLQGDNVREKFLNFMLAETEDGF